MYRNEVPPKVLMNENWQGYVQAWIYDNNLTWLEKTIASPYWTGMTLFCIELKRQEQSSHKKDCFTKTMFQSTGRICFKGQVFSAPMDQDEILEQLLRMEGTEPVELPVHGNALAARCQVWIASGLTDLNKLIRQATIRRKIVFDYICLLRDTGHPDFKHVTGEHVEAIRGRLEKMVPTDEPTVPPEILPSDLVATLEESDTEAQNDFLGTDKQATPQERNWSAQDLAKELARARPQVLAPQRDSDANQKIRESRVEAMRKFTPSDETLPTLHVGTGSSLLGQIRHDYFSRVFHTSIPWNAGGPEFYGIPHPRRQRLRGEENSHENAPKLSMKAYTSMMACRAEYNLRSDWDLSPAIWSCNFASEVNTMVGMGLRRCLRAGSASMDAIRDVDRIPFRQYGNLKTFLSRSFGKYTNIK
jgi:hypothetical protein